MEIGYFANSEKSLTKRTKTHIIEDGQPICGSKVDGEMQFVSKLIRETAVECERCVKIYSVKIDVKSIPKMMSRRPGWDYYFMLIAKTAANRSTCERAIVGAIIVQNNSVIATGYNGSPGGLDHCDDVGHLIDDGHCVRTVHAEMNAVIQCAVHGTNPQGATLYVTHFPCFLCTKILINAGIKRIVYLNPYRVDEKAVKMLEEAEVKVIRYIQEK